MPQTAAGERRKKGVFSWAGSINGTRGSTMPHSTARVDHHAAALFALGTRSTLDAASCRVSSPILEGCAPSRPTSPPPPPTDIGAVTEHRPSSEGRAKRKVDAASCRVPSQRKEAGCLFYFPAFPTPLGPTLQRLGTAPVLEVPASFLYSATNVFTAASNKVAFFSNADIELTAETTSFTPLSLSLPPSKK